MTALLSKLCLHTFKLLKIIKIKKFIDKLGSNSCSSTNYLLLITAVVSILLFQFGNLIVVSNIMEQVTNSFNIEYHLTKSYSHLFQTEDEYDLVTFNTIPFRTCIHRLFHCYYIFWNWRQNIFYISHNGDEESEINCIFGVDDSQLCDERYIRFEIKS